MMGNIRAIQWTADGWPVVQPERYAGVPKTVITDASIVGSWEQITLRYQYAVQQKSSVLVLSADKKVSGDVTSTWSYDSATRLLTINGVVCMVTEAWDWEAPVRKVTLTYSGINSAGVTIWAKKI